MRRWRRVNDPVRVTFLLLLLLVATACGQPPVNDRPVVAPEGTGAPPLTVVVASPQPYPAPEVGYPTPEGAYPAPVATVAATSGVLEATVVPDATIDVVIGTHRLEAEVVATPEKRSVGLMFRDGLPGNRGMLFVFAGPYTGTFWMRDTRIPLSIAFISKERRILNIEDMQPFDEITQHAPRGEAFYALEVNQGWFAACGIKPGDEVTFELPPDLVIR